MALPPGLGMAPNSGALAALRSQASMGNPPMGASPMATPSGNPGLQVQAASQVREAVRILELALPNMPFGSEEHKAILDAVKALSKSFPASESIPGVQMSTLRDLAQSAKTQAPLQALMRMNQSQQPGPAAGAPPSAAMPGVGGPAGPAMPDMGGGE